MPDSASAICCTSVAGIDTGDIAPISRNGVMMTAWLARLYSSIALSMRSSQRSGELQLISEIETGDSGSAPAEQDLAHRDRVARVLGGDHRAHVRLVGQRLQRVDHVEVARVERRGRRARRSCRPASRARRRTARAGRSSRSRPSSRRGARRPRARTAGRRRRRRPCGRRRCGASAPGCAPARSNSRGALATCSSTKSGSRKTLLSSTRWPAARKYSTASGSMNSMPSSETIRRQPRSRTSIASSLRIS